MDGSSDPFREQRKNRQAAMWPSASAVALRGRDWYADGGPERLTDEND